LIEFLSNFYVDRQSRWLYVVIV